MKCIEETIATVTRYFERAVVSEPIEVEILESLSDMSGPIPAEFTEFLLTANGLNLHLHDSVVGHVYGFPDLQRVLEYAAKLKELKLIPVRGDGCGNYDCLDIGTGPTRGAVLFWDHEVYERPSYLLGGTFTTYLDMWADNVMSCFFRNGDRNTDYVPRRLEVWPWLGPAPQAHPWPFDEKWMRRRDSRADSLLADHFLRAQLVPSTCE